MPLKERVMAVLSRTERDALPDSKPALPGCRYLAGTILTRR
jgi:hypothetical protein